MIPQLRPAQGQRPGVPGRMKEQRHEDYRSRAKRSDYPAELDQVASAYARRIIRELELPDTAANWRRLRNIMLDALVPRATDAPDEFDES